MSSFPFQRLLTLNMDNYFLMERLLSHEKPQARKYNKKVQKSSEKVKTIYGDKKSHIDDSESLVVWTSWCKAVHCLWYQSELKSEDNLWSWGVLRKVLVQPISKCRVAKSRRVDQALGGDWTQTCGAANAKLISANWYIRHFFSSMVKCHCTLWNLTPMQHTSTFNALTSCSNK